MASRAGYDRLVEKAGVCTRCDLYARATQTVFGEGALDASILLVGEQPGDREDIEGHPFVGPAGRVLDDALERAGIDRDDVFVSNVVKHFKWEPRGKRRIHQKPTLGEVKACRPWLETELALVRPRIIVCLGATAAQSLLGPQFRITRDHGLFFETSWAPWTTATLHPSAVLRMPDAEKRDAARQQLLDDLRKVAERLG